jgi:hypothetical protein
MNSTTHQCGVPDCKITGHASAEPFPTGWRTIKLWNKPTLVCKVCSSHFDYQTGQSHPSDISPKMRVRLEDSMSGGSVAAS